jgi:hypothetical protein
MNSLITGFAVLFIFGTSCKNRASTGESAATKAVDISEAKKWHNDFEIASDFTAKSADFVFDTTTKKESEIWSCQGIFFSFETKEWEKAEVTPIVFKKMDSNSWKVLNANLRDLDHILDETFNANNAKIYPEGGLVKRDDHWGVVEHYRYTSNGAVLLIETSAKDGDDKTFVPILQKKNFGGLSNMFSSSYGICRKER